VVGGSNRSAYLKWGNREPGIIFQIEIARGTTKKETVDNILHGVFIFSFIFVVMRNTCQVTNQSSHGELSFHHNPNLSFEGLAPLDFSRYSERRHKIEKCSSPFILSLL